MFHFPEKHRVENSLFRIGRIIGNFQDEEDAEYVTLAKWGAARLNAADIMQVRDMCFDKDDIVFVCEGEYTAELHRLKYTSPN